VLLQDQYADAKDPDRKQRRCAISLEVSPRIRSIDYSDLCEDIGLAEQLQLYESAVGTLFDDLSKQMPVIGKDGLNYSPNIRDTAISNNLCDSIGKSVGKKERALTDHFAWLWEHMRMLSKPDVPGVKQQSPYSLIDYQTKMAPGTRLQPDGLFVHKDITQETFATAHMILEAKWATCENGLDDEDLGQIGDYVLRIWTEQYTRIFVPVLLLHGGNVSLMVFTRQGVCVAELGPICVRQVKSQFVTGSDVTRMVRTADYNANNMVRLDERIDRPVKIFRRTSYMYRSKFADRPVILKLTWTPTYCYPEGAGYMMISEACNGYIPEVYLSGVLVKNSFGYRLEFLVLEDCGIPIDTYAIRCRNVGTKAEQFSATLAKSIKHVSECLAKAYAAGVLHRDISAGNIAIKGGQARLIDWGYSRARSDIDIPNLDEIERLFAFDNEAASMEERQHDSLTGTNLFMSVQMLMGSTERSLIHDLESLFFVGLYTLAKFQGSIGPKCDKLPLGFRRVGNEETAAIRVGCLSTKNLYLENFGIRDCPDVIAQVFDSMYQTLFMHNGRYIGGQMLADSNYAREIDLDMASKFMDTQILLTKSCSDLEMSGSQLLDESIVEGLSIDFLVYNVYGFSCYALFNTAFFFNKHIGDEYARRNDGHENLVRFNDLFFSYHALVLSLVTFAQSFYYKLGCSMIKYVPQAWLNYERKSTIGWSIHNIMLDFTGGTLSFAQLILDAVRSGNVTEALGNPVKFGMGLASIGFDLVFMAQHFVLYTDRYDPRDIEAQVRYQSAPLSYGSTDSSDVSTF
ncbi:hypothetical protein LPJ76_003409, partial [Coemansia sp. RSA 638]